MNLQKLNPWNWFKHEDDSRNGQAQVPVTRTEAATASVANGGLPTTAADSLFRLHREMDRLFSDVWNAFGVPVPGAAFPAQGVLGESSLPGDYTPSLDISGDDKQYEITLDVPGMSESDLSIDVSGDVLVIRGRKEEKNESRDKEFYRIERSYGAFKRTLSLPEDAGADNIRASLKDGILTLQIPRREAEGKDVKRISISS